MSDLIFGLVAGACFGAAVALWTVSVRESVRRRRRAEQVRAITAAYEQRAAELKRGA